jgi:DNA-binding NarL/FixJ family response regulator
VDAQVVGRDGPLAEVERFLREMACAPAKLVIEGEPGIGKSTLWQRAVDVACEREFVVLVSRPVESESALAYSGVADLLGHLDTAFLEVLPDPQRRALEVALLLSEPAGRAPEPRAIFAGFAGVLRSISRQAPVLVAVDDQQWLDKSSARALEYVWRRLEDVPVGMLATVRPEAATEPALRSGPGGKTVMRLDGLSPGALYQLIKAQLDVTLPRSTVLRVHRTTDGNPFFALELSRVLVVAGLPGAAEPWPVPDDLREMVGARVGRLAGSSRSVLLAAAAGSQPTVGGLSASAARTAERAGVVTIGEHGLVRFAHPLFASAIYGTATPEERRAVHAALAAAERDIEEQARHKALACGGVDEEVALLLDRAAVRARARGAPDVAAELQERAVALTPVDLPDVAWRRQVAAAEYLIFAGDFERARTLLVGAVEQSGQAIARSRALRLLGEVCYRLRYADEAVQNLRAAVAAADGDPAAVVRAELDLAYVIVSSFGSFEEAGAAAARALALAEQLGERTVLSSALAAVAITDLILGRGLDEAKVARALRLEDQDEPTAIERRPSFLAGWAYLNTDRLDRARAVLEPLRARMVDHGEESDLPELLALLARVECLAGNLTEAAAHVDSGYAIALQTGSDSLGAYTRAMRAVIDAHAGRADEARAAAADAVELAGRSGWQLAAFWASTALGLLELSLGDDEAVITTLAHSIELVEEHGLPEPSRCPFLPDAIEALVHRGELERADSLTRTLERRGEELERRSAVIAGARCRALVLAARGDVADALDGLERTLAKQVPLPMPLELARTLIVKGQLQRRRKQKRAARESLRHALSLCEETGATLWAARARSELARVAATREPDDLTATEGRVASLAASGLTNREIAATAFMSQKTVEANLSRIYRKLGIRSRAELGVRIAASEAERPSRQPGRR